MKKKLSAVVIAVAMVCGILVGCGQSSTKNDAPAPAKTADSGKEGTDKAKENIDTGKENTNKTKEDIDSGKENNDKENENSDTSKENKNKAKGANNGEKKGTSSTNYSVGCSKVISLLFYLC
ncbi:MULTISPECIES: hypothetical protein [unclassified Clostridium]|uniref:hypothetical protein n=1 Tax=unclassified Clostridium TaxID=2614128 RepID=UPI000297EA5B|nr:MULTISPECIES: hypothetical protein [unclassified Clostridium]EKQ53591.1 MAG: hypothetical protein A370_03636 [Clostridium sp. Maddingley MBC34-26]